MHAVAAAKPVKEGVVHQVVDGNQVDRQCTCLQDSVTQYHVISSIRRGSSAKDYMGGSSVTFWLCNVIGKSFYDCRCERLCRFWLGAEVSIHIDMTTLPFSLTQWLVRDSRRPTCLYHVINLHTWYHRGQTLLPLASYHNCKSLAANVTNWRA
jgi:hypothetical protein